MISSILDVLCLNNEGIKQLRQGQYERAMDFFKDALAMSKCLPLASHGDAMNSHGSSFIGSSFSLSIQGIVVGTDEEASPGNIFTFYNRAIMVSIVDPVSLAHCELDTIQMRRELLFCIVYNIAFSSHLAGLRHHQLKSSSSPSSDQHLIEAVGIYEILLDLLPNTESFCTPNNIIVVSLAVWSNLGHLQSHFCRRDASIQCREELRRSFAQVNKQSPHALSREEYGFFFFNIVFSFSIDMKVAPAA